MPASGHTRYVHELKGSIRSLTDAKPDEPGSSTTPGIQLHEGHEPLGQVRTFSYDVAGPDPDIDAKGQRVEFRYDDAIQLTGKIPEGSAVP